MDVVERLDSEALLPAIVFIFSRAGCDAAVMQCARTGPAADHAEERDEVTRIVEKRCSDIPNEDLAVLGYHDWYDGLLRGVAVAPRRTASSLQRSRRGAVHPRPGQGDLRDRDTGSRDQHAGAIGRA